MFFAILHRLKEKKYECTRTFRCEYYSICIQICARLVTKLLVNKILSLNLALIKSD